MWLSGSRHWSALLGTVVLYLVLVVSTTLTEGTSLSRPTGLTVVDLEPSSVHGVVVTLTWRYATGSNASLMYYVRYAPQGGQSTQKMVSSKRAVLKLAPNTWYLIRVKAADNNGPWSQIIRIWTNESVPSISPVNVTAISEDTSSIRVFWQPIPPQYQHAQLQGYIVFYRKRSSRRWRRQTVGASTHQARITGLASGMQYMVAVAGFTNKGAGKKSLQAVATVKGDVIPETFSSTIVSSLETSTIPSSSPTSPQLQDVDVSTPTSIASRTSHADRTDNIDVDVSTPTSIASRTSHADRTDNIGIAPVQKAASSKTKHSSFLDIVFKVILPSVGGGLILVLLIICLLWRKRRANKNCNRQQEAIGLQALSDNKNITKEKSKVVTRGEGSIRYAPPSCPSGEGRDELSPEENGTSGFEDTSPMLVEASMQSDNIEDERYVSSINPTHTPAAKCTTDHSKIYAVPFAHLKPSSNETMKSDKNAGYANMQHLYESLDGKEKNENKHLYANLPSINGTPEDLYSEIPAIDTGDDGATHESTDINMKTSLVPPD